MFVIAARFFFKVSKNETIPDPFSALGGGGGAGGGFGGGAGSGGSGSPFGHSQPLKHVGRIRTVFPETWLWSNTTIG